MRLLVIVMLALLVMAPLMACQPVVVYVTPVVVTATPSGSATADVEATPTGEGWETNTSVPAPTATQPVENCYELPLLSEGFLIVSKDSCLNSRESSRGNGQTAPAEWGIANEIENADGIPDDYTGYAGIVPEDEGYRFIVEGRAGRWGFTQQVDLEAGCYVAKIAGYVSVVEMAHSGQSNIGAHAYIGEYDLLFAPFPSGRRLFPLHWSIWIPTGQYLFQMLVEARYATAMPGTEVVIQTVALAQDLSGGSCR